MTRYARGKPPLEEAVEGRAQSVHLEHLMNIDWEEPLVPPARALVRSCTCDEEGCAHVAALAYAFADELDRDPSLLLRLRGCDEEEEPAAVDEPGRPPPTIRRRPVAGGAAPAASRPAAAPHGGGVEAPRPERRARGRGRPRRRAEAGVRVVCGVRRSGRRGTLTRPTVPQSTPNGVLRGGYDTGGFYDEVFEATLGGRGGAAARTTPSSSRKSRRWTAATCGAPPSSPTGRSCTAG